MNKKLIAALFAGAFAFVSASAMAQDKTAPIPVDEAKLKAERADKKAAAAKMTKEEKAAAKKAANAKKKADADAMGKLGSVESKAAAEAKATAASKAGPAPAKGTINTPEVDKALQKQKQ